MLDFGHLHSCRLKSVLEEKQGSGGESSLFKINKHLNKPFSKLIKWLSVLVEASLERGLREVKRSAPGHTAGEGLVL